MLAAMLGSKLVHLLVYCVDVIGIGLYVGAGIGLWRRRRVDALVSARLYVIVGVVASLGESLVFAVTDGWASRLSLFEPTQIAIGILFVLGWVRLIDTWMHHPPPLEPPPRLSRRALDRLHPSEHARSRRGR